MPTNQENLTTVKINVSNYVQFTQNNNLRNYAFTIQLTDIINTLGLDPSSQIVIDLMNNTPFQNIRAYLGLDNNTSEFKLYLTPITGNVNLPGQAGNDFILPNNQQGPDAYLLDLIYPCPNCCPTESPLYYQNFL